MGIVAAIMWRIGFLALMGTVEYLVTENKRLKKELKENKN